MINNDEIYKFTGKYGVTKIEIEENIRYADVMGNLGRVAYCAGPTMVTMKITRDSLKAIADLDNNATIEANIRESNPTVARAYEQYRTLLNLVR